MSAVPCPHSREALAHIHRDAKEGLATQERFLTEGCCPNRCGIMLRVGERVAMCPCCGFQWTSPRVLVVFPARTKESA